MPIWTNDGKVIKFSVPTHNVRAAGLKMCDRRDETEPSEIFGKVLTKIIKQDRGIFWPPVSFYS